MNLVGNLEDLGLGEILQIVSLSRKSGILTLNGIKGEGEIVFRQGEVIRAASPEFQESLADLLLRRGCVDSPTMSRALSLHESEGFKERLGTILVRHFHLPAATVEEVIREQIETVVCSFFAWNLGTFDFELHEHVEVVDSMEAEQMQFVLEKGINSQFLALEGLRRLDEKRHCGIDPEAAKSLPPECAPTGKRAGAAAIFSAEDTSPSADSDLEPDKRHIIVLVDDHTATREALTSSLEACGYEVYPFAGGADSPLMMLAALFRDGQRPTLLIDLIMPKMDGTGIMGGVELLELIKTNFTDIPVLAMADCHNDEAERELRRMGFPLIIKPREDEIENPGVLNIFMGSLLPGLNQVKSGRDAPESLENVNLGDELRQEMGEETASPAAPVVQSTGIALLRGMLEELNDPALGGGIILLVLRFASEFMNRGVVFIVERDRIVGLGQFGIDAGKGSADSIVRNMKIPRNEDSLFARVIDSRLSVKVGPDDGAWTRYLLEKLGGEAPAEIFVGPIVSEGKVVALLYGDNLPDKKQIGDTDTLEIFLSQAGVAMENAFLQRKLKGKGMEGM
jgi:CheY-like chemotaxis protein